MVVVQHFPASKSHINVCFSSKFDCLVQTFTSSRKLHHGHYICEHANEDGQGWQCHDSHVSRPKMINVLEEDEQSEQYQHIIMLEEIESALEDYEVDDALAILEFLRWNVTTDKN